MNTTEFLLEVRDLVKDPEPSAPGSTQWPDAEILRLCDRHGRSLNRKRAEVDEGYATIDLNVAIADLVRVASAPARPPETRASRRRSSCRQPRSHQRRGS